MGKVVTLFNDGIEPVHMVKDLFLTGYYLAKERGEEYELWACDSFPELSRGCVVRRFSLEERAAQFHEQLKKEAKSISVLILFHMEYEYIKFVHDYLKFNPKGKVYIKFDYPPLECYVTQYRQKNVLKYLVKKAMYFWCFSKIKVFSIETKTAYDYFIKNKFYGANIKKKLVLMHNAYDDDQVNSINVKEYSEKENIIITVGRIGNFAKNNELMLATLNRLDMKDWKFYFIGDYTPEFAALLESSPNRDKIILTGNISDRKELFEYYNRAKVFLLASPIESYCLALNEAVFYNNYIISTPVGVAPDIIKNEKTGIMFKSGDEDMLTEILGGVIDSKIDVSQVSSENADIRNSLYSSNLVKKVNERLG